jgi:hypothetical protein
MVEATKNLNSDDSEKILYWGDIVKAIDAVPRYVEGLQVLGVSAPIVVMISLSGLSGARLGLKGYDSRLDEIQPFPADDPLVLPEITIDDFAPVEAILSSLAPIADSLWNAAGFSKCTYYNRDGKWRPPR